MNSNNKKKSAIILAAGNSRRMKSLTSSLPKSMLEIKGRKIIDFHLDNLYRLNFSQIIIVIGYLPYYLENYIGKSYRGISIEYVVNEEFAKTGHSYSFTLGAKFLDQKTNEVFLIHADGLFSQEIYKKLNNSKFENIIPFDSNFKINTHDEIIVFHEKGFVKNIEKISMPIKNDCGELLGIHKFSKTFIKQFLDFLNFQKNNSWKKLNYEPLLDLFLQKDNICVNALDIKNLPWININYESDLKYAENFIYPKIYSSLENKMAIHTNAQNTWGYEDFANKEEKVSINICDSLNKFFLGGNKNFEIDLTHSDLRNFINDLAEEIKYKIFNGSGFCIVKDLKLFNDENMLKIYKLICKSLGHLVPQDSLNTLFYPVFSTGSKMSDGERYSRSSDSGSFHTDNPSEENVPDIVSLISIREAYSGGYSCIVNMTLVLEDLFMNSPKIANSLESQFPFIRKNKIEEKNQNIAFFPILKFSENYSFRYLADYISKENLNSGKEKDILKLKSLRILDEKIKIKKYRTEFLLKRGEMIFFNNKNLAHGRTSFVDEDNKNKKRLMYRTWLMKKQN